MENPWKCEACGRPSDPFRQTCRWCGGKVRDPGFFKQLAYFFKLLLEKATRHARRP